ncbi:Scavenger receptor class B member 1 [Pseudolycoriella hygida]|uniref:Scavenger receptor class B member 1 n=1 Tax=Pseudolycoriella hygida TaxID=35572 RepID=A0A9Q0MVJ2_9DIPT|nr:Scavenger receptor class B member 1 [Pseudolycoriella hygida]
MLPPNVTVSKFKSFKLDAESFRRFKFAALGMLFVCTASLIVLFDPITQIVKDQLSIREGSLLFFLFKNPPLEVFISVYVFNVTNVEAFLSKKDSKLKVEEVGPYVYREFLEHTNYTFHSNGTLTYFPKRTVKFIREKSVGDPKTDIVTVPNIPYLGASTAAAEMSVFAALALSTLTATLNSQPMLNLTVEDYLWGYEDRLVKLASNVIPKIITFESFGILDRMFDEGTNAVTINLPQRVEQHKEELERQLHAAHTEPKSDNADENLFTNFIDSEQENVADSMDKKDTHDTYKPQIRDYSIDSWNGLGGLDYWGYSNNENDASKNTMCNTLSGTYDGTLFPQNISQNEEFRVYRKAFCRTLPIRFDHAGEMDGLQAYYFELAENAFDSEIDDPSSSCFCSNGKCLKKGLGNITPCYYNIPTAVSYPHFYRSDPSLLNEVDGLEPNAERHSSEIILQPQLGVPMRVHSRLQINLLLNKSKFNSRVKPFDNTVIPIVWVEISVERLTPGLIILLHLLFNILPYVQLGAVCLLCVFGVSLFAVAALSHCFSSASSASKSDYNPKRDIKYSAIYKFPYIKRKLEKYVDGDHKYQIACEV